MGLVGGFKLWAFIFWIIPFNWKSISKQGGDILRYPKLRVHGVNSLDTL